MFCYDLRVVEHEYISLNSSSVYMSFYLRGNQWSKCCIFPSKAVIMYTRKAALQQLLLCYFSTLLCFISILHYTSYHSLPSHSPSPPSFSNPSSPFSHSRLDSFTKHMNGGRYKEYCEARRASFCPRLRVAKFREWLLVDQSADIKLSQVRHPLFRVD